MKFLIFICILIIGWYVLLQLNKRKKKKIHQAVLAIGDKEKKFELPSEPDPSQYKEPRITQKRIEGFIAWSKQTNNKKGRDKLSELINKKLEVVVPEVGVDLMGTYKIEGVIKSFDYDFDIDVYRIEKYECASVILNIDNDELVLLLDKPELSPVFDDEYSFQIFWDKNEEIPELDIERVECYGATLDAARYFLIVDDSEYISKSSDADKEFEEGIATFTTAGSVGVEGEHIRIEIDRVDSDISVEINGTEFKFCEEEHDHLITLLMASYKPSLLKKILKELEGMTTENAMDVLDLKE